MKCSDCNKDLVDLSKWHRWQYLMFLIEILYDEGQITYETYEKACDALMYFKVFADEGNQADVIVP